MIFTLANKHIKSSYFISNEHPRLHQQSLQLKAWWKEKEMDSNLSWLRILNRWRPGQFLLRWLEILWENSSSQNSIRHQKWDQKAVWQWKNHHEWRSDEKWCLERNRRNQEKLIKQWTFRENGIKTLLKILTKPKRNRDHTWTTQHRYWSLKNS